MFQLAIHSVPNAGAVSLKREEELTTSGGMSTLGRGCFAAVYGSDRHDWVTKVTFGDDWGYVSFLEELSRVDANPWLPVIYAADVYMDDAGKTCSVVRMERLRREWNAWGEASPGFEQFVEIMREIRSQAYGFDKFQWILDNRELMAALDLIDRAHKASRCMKDMHAGNIMMRGRNQLVITDPLGYPE